MLSPFNGPACFFVIILVFIVIGFQRGWKRELVSLVSVLLASVLVNATTSDSVSNFLGRIPAIFAFMSGSPAPQPAPVSFLGGPAWSLIIFAGLVVGGYFIGNKVFPKPATPHERFIGVILGVLSGAFVLWYVNGFVQGVTGQTSLNFDTAAANPSSYIPIIFVITILALVVAVIAARLKKAKK